MRILPLIALIGLAPFAFADPPARAAALDLGALTCEKYENEVLPAAPSNPDADSIDTVMWLFGFSVAKSGKHVLYPDALSPFGFALDNECKSNPRENMLDALTFVKPETQNPLDLAQVECGSFATRHAEFARSDTESAKTIMMWLFGFGVGQSGGREFDASGRSAFESALLAECAREPHSKLLDSIKSLKMGKPVKPAPRPHPVRPQS